MSNKSVNKVAVATKHPGVFMQTTELETETGQELPIVETGTDTSPGEKGEPKVDTEPELDEEEEEMNLSDDQHVLPESDRIDEVDENETKTDRIDESESKIDRIDLEEQNESLVCDESVEDIDDEDMEPLSLSDDDSAEEIEKEPTKKKADKTVELEQDEISG